MAEFQRMPTQEELQKILYMGQMQGKTTQEIINENLNKGGTIKPLPESFFTTASAGAKRTGEFINKAGTAADVAKLFPGYQPETQVTIPTSFNVVPKMDPYSGQMGGTGINTQQMPIGNVLQQINPFDVLPISSAERAYGDIGAGKAPQPMDVVDTLGLGVGGIAAGKGLLGVAKATKGLPVGMSIKEVKQSGLLSDSFNVIKRDASDTFGAGTERIRYVDPKSGGTIEVLSKPDNTASVMSLEVPEQFRGKKIGESLQARALQDFPELQGQVSSKAAAKTAYRLGRRPVGEPNATLDDVFKAIEDNSSVNLVSPEMQKRFAGDIKSVKPLGSIIDDATKSGLKLDLYEKNGVVNLSRIEVPKELRNSGIGSDVMSQIVNYADSTGNKVTLTPSTNFGATSVSRLKDFYKKFGFIENKGKNKDFSTRETMYRNPQE